MHGFDLIAIGLQVRNSYCLRAAAITHLFTNVLPIPMPPESAPALVGNDGKNHGSKCFWTGSPMRHETQAAVLQALRLISRHLACAYLSVRPTRSFDAARCVTFACIAAIADAVMRVVAFDFPSQARTLRDIDLYLVAFARTELMLKYLHFAAQRVLTFHMILFDKTERSSLLCRQLALHYSGAAAGPVLPFGVSLGDFALESEHLLCVDPALACARARVLEYFGQLNRFVRADHLVMRFDETDQVNVGHRVWLCVWLFVLTSPALQVSAGDARLVRQLCVQMGFPRGVSPEHDAAAYLSGTAPELLDNYPQLGVFRDIIFYLKLMLNPSMDALPPLRRWEPREASLTWSHETVSSGLPGFRKVTGEHLRIQGFGRTLSAVHAKRPPERGVLSRLLRSGQKPRAPPSGADPELVVGPGVRTEDDVLHVPNTELPDFGARMSHADTELLCQYLTVPYLRIPLLLDFFRCVLLAYGFQDSCCNTPVDVILSMY